MYIYRPCQWQKGKRHVEIFFVFYRPCQWKEGKRHVEAIGAEQKCGQ